jgi:cytochrome c peroxidase
VLIRKREGKDLIWVGGNFWDGRATGEKLGSPAADQAQGPFLNPVEQGLPDAACVVFRVSKAEYADLYAQVWGDSIRSIGFPANTDQLCAVEGTTVPLSAHDRAGVAREFDRIALSIAAFEDAPEVNRFSSKFDAWRDGKAKLTSEEQRGLTLFQGKARCERCHPSDGKKPLFTDFTYDNLGVPKNPENPGYAKNPAFVDLGLGGFLRDQSEYGKMRVPTLRNIDRRPFPGAAKAYMHNGVFKSLEQLVHFYNTRDVLPRCETLAAPVSAVNCWPAPEVEQNMNRDELGNLGLSEAEERAIVVFLKTLSDGYVPR